MNLAFLKPRAHTLLIIMCFFFVFGIFFYIASGDLEDAFLYFPLVHAFWLMGLVGSFGFKVTEGGDYIPSPNSLGIILIIAGSIISFFFYYFIASLTSGLYYRFVPPQQKRKVFIIILFGMILLMIGMFSISSNKEENYNQCNESCWQFCPSRDPANCGGYSEEQDLFRCVHDCKSRYD